MTQFTVTEQLPRLKQDLKNDVRLSFKDGMPKVSHVPNSQHEKNGKIVTSTPEGHEVTYTLDPELHKSAERSIAKAPVKRAAALILDAETGEVLAMAGKSPDVDPFLYGGSPAASTFKIVTLAACQENGLKPDTQIDYPTERGTIKTDKLDLNKVHENQTTPGLAFAYSNNVAFARMALKFLSQSDKASYTKILTMASRFGFNKKISFDLEAELPVAKVSLPKKQGERPNLELKVFGEMVAGFRNSYSHPIHQAMIMSVIVNGGIMLRPRLIEKIKTSSKKVIYRGAITKTGRTLRPSNYMNDFKEMMTETTTRGTASQAFNDADDRPLLPGAKIIGKTGTLTGLPSSVDGHPDGIKHISDQKQWFSGAIKHNGRKYAVVSWTCGYEKKDKGTQAIIARELMQAITQK